MVGQGLSREKVFVLTPGTMMILEHQLSVNTKSNWPFVLKLIPGKSPAHDASFQLEPVLQEVADMSSPRFWVSGRC